jgi:hypothetical protein
LNKGPSAGCRRKARNDWGLHPISRGLLAMQVIPDNFVDMVLCDLPYGTTACKWDEIIPFELLWAEYRRIVMERGAMVFTAAQPFTSKLIMSNVNEFKYSLVWQKSRVQHFAQAPYRFLTEHEDICVFSRGGCSKNAKVRMMYNPQGLVDCHVVCQGKGHSDHRPSTKVGQITFRRRRTIRSQS